MGDIHIIEAMIRCLSEHGVDIVKTQSWQARKLSKHTPNYQLNYEYYKNHQLNEEKHYEIKKMCDRYGIEMLTTCFDLERVESLASLGLKIAKVASSDSASYKMIEMLLERFESLIISTGATTEEELEKTINLCKGRNVVFLHCVTKYPCPLDEVNMKRMLYLKEKGVRVGYSDHTMGTEASKYAICLGAEYIEKHFTLNRYLPGKDQSMSATIEELSELVQWAKLIDSMQGLPVLSLSDDELSFRKHYVGKWGKNE